MLQRLLGIAGVAVVLGAGGWALAGGSAAPVVTLVVIGVVLTAADAVVWRAAAGTDGSGGSDLAVPAGRRLPPPSWGLLVGVAAALGLGASIVVGAPLAAVGAALVLAATGAGFVQRAPEQQVRGRTAWTARRLRSFARAHGAGPGEPVGGYATPVGESGVRMFVVAPDGRWADAMVGAGEVAEIAGLARVDLSDPADPAVAQRVRVDLDLWTAMARSW
ncbi:MAG TPA: hypothetical protein VK585_09605 [Jiangellaceae bacterium]|nr:hypothetical protein [Jiangellaceae bacterium]